MLIVAFLLFIILLFCLCGLGITLAMNFFFGKLPSFVINQLNEILENFLFFNPGNPFFFIVRVLVITAILCFVLLIIIRKISGGFKWSGSAFICAGIVIIAFTITIASMIDTKEIGKGLLYAAKQSGIKLNGTAENAAIRLFISTGITGAVSLFTGIVLIITGTIAKRIREKRRKKKAEKPVQAIHKEITGMNQNETEKPGQSGNEENILIKNEETEKPGQSVNKETIHLNSEEAVEDDSIMPIDENKKDNNTRSGLQGKESKISLKINIPDSLKKILIFSGAGIVLVVIIVCIVLFINRDTSIKTVINTFDIKASDNESVSVKADNRLSVDLPFGTLKKDDELVISSVENIPGPDGITLPYMYDISMKKDNRFDNYITISLPLELSHTPSLANNYYMPVAVWFDTSSKEWKPASYEIDVHSHRIHIYTDHLTTHSVVQADQTAESGPMKKVPFPKFPCVPFLPSADMTDISRIFLKGTNTEEALLAGWTIGLTWFGYAGNAGTLAEEVLEIEQLKEINTYAGYLGLGFTLIQYTLDISSGNKATAENAYINLVKGVKDFAIGTWGSKYLKIGNVAGFIIEYRLTQFYNAAIQSRNKRWEAGYREYYKEMNEKKYTKKWWYDNILRIINKVKKPDNLVPAVDAFINKYLSEFWSLSYDKQYIYCEQAPQSLLPIKGDITEDIENKISLNYKTELKKIIDEVSLEIEKKIRMEQMNEVYNQLIKMQRKLNQVYSIKIVLAGKKEQKENASVVLSATPGWSGKMDGNGEWKLNFTLFGYLEANTPDRVTVTCKTKDNKTQIVEKSFSIKGRNTTVSLTIPEEKVPEVVAETTALPQKEDRQTQTDTGEETSIPRTDYSKYRGFTPDQLMFLLEERVRWLANEVYNEKRYPPAKAVMEVEAIFDYIVETSDEVDSVYFNIDSEKYLELVNLYTAVLGKFHEPGLKNPERFTELKKLSSKW
ncbi:MAG: hypothetical protein JXB88_10010 [Spirochaetales bacterium]|nr:hypothetical protein [Spirochaetales bacterium]